MAKAQAQEPSMEEILASIRRIIADEETAPKGAAAKASEAQETISEDDLDKLFASTGDAEEDEDVLELTDEVDANDPPLVEGIGEETDLAFEDIQIEPEPEPEPAPPPPPPVKAKRVEPAPVIAPAPEPEPEPEPVVAAKPEPKPAPAPAPIPAPVPAIDAPPLISQAAEGLIASAFADLSNTVLARNARTLEDLVQDMLRPMLKSWLDQNLPGMVERLIKAEIERVTRGR